MKEFEKWWEDYPTGGTREDKEYAKVGWTAALEFIKKKLYEVRAHGFEPDLGLYKLLEGELEGENAKT